MGCGDDPGHVVFDDQGDDVSSHADTIRAYIESWGFGHRQLEDGSRTAVQLPREPALASLDALLAENQRLRDALEHYANPQHWGITRDGNEPVPTWIGTYRKPPTDLAREALAGDAE